MPSEAGGAEAFASQAAGRHFVAGEDKLNVESEFGVDMQANELDQGLEVLTIGQPGQKLVEVERGQAEPERALNVPGLAAQDRGSAQLVEGAGSAQGRSIGGFQVQPAALELLNLDWQARSNLSEAVRGQSPIGAVARSGLSSTAARDPGRRGARIEAQGPGPRGARCRRPRRRVRHGQTERPGGTFSTRDRRGRPGDG